ncbi:MULTISPECIES: helix-turn-helix domain-containing protein [Bacillus amyloliquefaciens group]|uniref:helix-turn-helix domain-containing protein n=1 Tax=Bacillus amyloliquefaciens group TaxID=1938374 RepID=UPI000A5DDA2D|nr:MULTISPECIES: helix-turn-helix transcriptional regulator [Bacillus amyloliquefaciens group]
MSEEKFSLADYIYRLRTERNLKQNELAKRAGLTTSYISQIESGKRTNPSPKTMEKIAQALSIQTRDVIKVLDFTSGENPINNLRMFDVSGLDDLDIEWVENQVELLKIKNKYKEMKRGGDCDA